MAVCKLTKAEATELAHLIDAYEGACANLSQFLTQVQGGWESEIEEKSEKWQESDTGQEAQARLETLEQWIEELPETLEANHLDEIS